MMMDSFFSLALLKQVRAFDAQEYYRFLIAQTQVGWVRRDLARYLITLNDFFEHSADCIALSPRFSSFEQRTTALSNVVAKLALQGVIHGWRDELYAIRNQFDATPLALIERSACRFFGLKTYAVHVNGIVKKSNSVEFWVAQRSLNKSVSPGYLDNLTAGGITWPLSVEQTLIKEGWEEAGIKADLAQQALYQNTVFLLRGLPEGLQNEQMFIYDLALPEDFLPENQDSEVHAFQRISFQQLVQWMHESRFTVDATLAHYDYLRRNRLAMADAQFSLLLKPVHFE